jgi:hypothetical protein
MTREPCSLDRVPFPIITTQTVLTLELQDKENVTPGLDCATGTTYDAPSAAGNDGAEDYLAQTLNHCTVEANDWHSSLNYLALDGDVLESLAFEFDRIETNMYDKLDTTACSDAKGVATWKQLDEITGVGATATCPDGSMATPSPAIFCAKTSSGTVSRSTTVPSSGARTCISAMVSLPIR